MLFRSKEKKLIRVVGDLVLHKMQDNLNETKTEYENEGKSDELAENLAFNDHLSNIRRTLRNMYAEFLTTFMNVQEKSFIFNTLMTTAKSLREEHRHYTWEDAFNQSVRQHKVLLNKLVTERNVQEDTEEEEAGTESEEEEGTETEEEESTSEED